MIIPSIDLQSGKAVQLIGGKEFAVDGGDPLNWASEFGIAGEIGVIDLDAALGTGNNRETIVGILRDRWLRFKTSSSSTFSTFLAKYATTLL
jgi:phosphoribosyl-ATP pyrophosphohydrolase/phosphoribosyl-AMP cyclohydrolase